MSSNLDYLRQYAPITVNIQGEVSFFFIFKLYEGEELIAANKRAQEHGGLPSNRPYCTLSLDNPRILNPQTLPADVVAVMQERFKLVKGTNTARYYATSKSPSLPPVAYSVYAGAELAGQGIADKLHPLEYELDTGLTVTVGARIFNTAAGVGVGIDYVLIDEPIRYYESNALADALASQGVTYVAPTADKRQGGAATQPVADKAANHYVLASDGFANLPEGLDVVYPTGDEMPFEQDFYYEDTNNTAPVAAQMRNTAPKSSMNNNRTGQGGYKTQPQGNADRNAAGQNIYGASMQQPQGNVSGQNVYGAQMQPQGNPSGQGAYKARMQPQGNRAANAQTGQMPASPMVRMGTPRQPQGRTA